jgi:hypothetical protein
VVSCHALLRIVSSWIVSIMRRMLDLLRRREMPSTGWKIGDTRHAREGDYGAVFETDALLACSLERGCDRHLVLRQAETSHVRACDSPGGDGVPS